MIICRYIHVSRKYISTLLPSHLTPEIQSREMIVDILTKNLYMTVDSSFISKAKSENWKQPKYTSISK